MNNLLKLRRLAFYCFALSFFMTCQEKQNNFKNDRMTIIKDSSYTKFMIGKEFNLWNPNIEDFKKVDLILTKSIKDGEFFFLENETISEIQKYYRQYLYYINEKGENIVFINSMCNLSDYYDQNNSIENVDWKKEMLKIADGGDCYWSIKINSTKEEYFSLRINTES